MTASDVFGVRAPAGADPATIATYLQNLRDDGEAMGVLLAGIERVILRQPFLVDTSRTAGQYWLTPSGTPRPQNANFADALTLWTPSALELAPSAQLKSKLKLRVTAFSGESDPTNAGDTKASLFGASSWSGGGAGQAGVTLSASALDLTIPTLLGNGAGGVATSAEIDLAYVATTYCLGLTVVNAISANGIVFGTIELVQRFIDAD